MDDLIGLCTRHHSCACLMFVMLE